MCVCVCMKQSQEGGSVCVCMEQGQEGGSVCVCMEQGQEGSSVCVWNRARRVVVCVCGTGPGGW